MNGRPHYAKPVQRRIALALVIIVCAAAVSAMAPTYFTSSDGPRLWSVLALGVSACLAFNIARLARHRLTHEHDASPDAGVPSPEARSLQTQVQNTLEQAVLAMSAYAAWVLLTPPDLWSFAVAAGGLFVVGRVLFTLGYKGGPTTRALGFALTFYPTLALILAGLVVAVRA